jgi:hypothetical protein
MRLWLRLFVTLIVVAAIGTAAWIYWNRRQLAWQWASYRVGTAQTAGQAQAEIARLESGPDCSVKLRELVDKWGAGNPQFDLYLARYVESPESSEALRRAFSLGFAWHEDRLPRWAHYWSWRAKNEPGQEIASMLAYLDLLEAAGPSKTITWREVLDLQAVFCLAGEPRLAVRLDPENWRDRYHKWREGSGSNLPQIDRPGMPFPDWQGPVPQAETP